MTRREPVHEPAGCATEAVLVAAFAGTAFLCVTGSWWAILAVTALLGAFALNLWGTAIAVRRHTARSRHPTRHLRPVDDNVRLLRPDDEDGVA